MNGAFRSCVDRIHVRRDSLAGDLAGYFQPGLFDNSCNLVGRRKRIETSLDLREDGANDPVFSAQSAVVTPIAPTAPEDPSETSSGTPTSSVSKSVPKALLKLHWNGLEGLQIRSVVSIRIWFPFVECGCCRMKMQIEGKRRKTLQCIAVSSILLPGLLV